MGSDDLTFNSCDLGMTYGDLTTIIKHGDEHKGRCWFKIDLSMKNGDCFWDASGICPVVYNLGKWWNMMEKDEKMVMETTGQQFPNG